MITYVRTGDVPLDELTPFPGNARRGRVDVIRQSLERNGQYRSLVVREIKDGPLVVLAGNHTLAALVESEAGEARCEVITCDDATARRINLVDNRSGDLATDDADALADILRDLDDYAGTGYTDADVSAILTANQNSVPDFEPETEDDQPRLDQTSARECPACGHTWYLNSSGDPITVLGAS